MVNIEEGGGIIISSMCSKTYLGSRSGLTTTANSLDLDQAGHVVGPDLSTNCLQLLSINRKLHGPNLSLEVCSIGNKAK